MNCEIGSNFKHNNRPEIRSITLHHCPEGWVREAAVWRWGISAEQHLQPDTSAGELGWLSDCHWCGLCGVRQDCGGGLPLSMSSGRAAARGGWAMASIWVASQECWRALITGGGGGHSLKSRDGQDQAHQPNLPTITRFWTLILI